MQAIETKYLGPTNTRGARVVARAQAGRISVPWDHALSVEENHDAAARAFIRKMEWFGTWVRGAGVLDKGNVYVCAKREGTPGVPSYRTPHPQAVNPLDVLYVRSEESP